MKKIIRNKTIYKGRSYSTLVDISKQYSELLTNRDIAISFLHLYYEGDPRIVCDVEVLDMKWSCGCTETLVFELN